MPKRVHFEERSNWSWWVHPLVSITFISAVIPLLELANGNVGGGEGAMPVWVAVLCLLLGFGIPGSIYLFMGQLRSRVTSEGVEVRWGLAEVIKKTIPFQEILEVKPVTYSPLGEFGGWGIRMGGKKKKAWNIRGNRAVLLLLSDGTRFYLGSDRPERMVEWIRSVGKGKLGGQGSFHGNSQEDAQKEE